jgi:hypothetical protein
MRSLADLVLDLVPQRTRPDDPVAAALAVDMPVELSLGRDGTGRLTVCASAPTQTFETTLLPVFHRVELHMELEER